MRCSMWSRTLPEEKPRYLMGVGTADCLVEGWPAGWICLTAYYRRGSRNGRRWCATEAGDPQCGVCEGFRPIDEACDCYACRNHTWAYIRHLIKDRGDIGRYFAFHSQHEVYDPPDGGDTRAYRGERLANSGADSWKISAYKAK